MTRHPLEMLKTIAADGGTGEFICASSTSEVHVFFQHGRIAWATDSLHPSAFTRSLQKSADLDPEAFRDILDSCRREKRPLGETLVSWGVASWDEVRDALRGQIELALEVLRPLPSAQTVFLDRTQQFATYGSELTFDVTELLGATSVGADEAASTASAAVPPSSPGGRVSRRLFDVVDGIVWTELLDGETVLERFPTADDGASLLSVDIVSRTVLDGADLAVLRAPEGTLAGVALAGSRSLWCRLSVEATVGVAVAALSVFALKEGGGVPAAALEGGAPPWAVGESAVNAELRDFLSRAPESLAALITDGVDREPSCGVGSSITPECALDIVARRTAALNVPAPFVESPATCADPNDVAFNFRTLLTREKAAWCFGTELGPRHRKTLWLLLDRSSSQGLGWAYLTSLSRRLLHMGRSR